ncbi:MAG TPA: hypothetical protein VFA50_12390 [Stellaceae bacterium]|nr:hypothetical protein [Stellaceae bacterium]
MRSLPVLLGTLVLAACAAGQASPSGDIGSVLPQFITGLPEETPQFAVSALQQGALPEGYAEINNQSPGVPAIHAAQICTLGQQMSEAAPVPGAPIGLTVATVRCNLYRPSL